MREKCIAKCGKQLEEDWKVCPYCGNRNLNGDQEERLKREEDRKYNRKMAIWLLISCVTVIGVAAWVNSIWYGELFFMFCDDIQDMDMTNALQGLMSLLTDSVSMVSADITEMLKSKVNHMPLERRKLVGVN